MQINEIVDLAKSAGTELTKKVILSTGIEIEYDWAAHKPETFAALLGGMKESSPDDFETIESKFTAIEELKSEPKNRTLMREFLDKVHKLPEDETERKTLLNTNHTIKVAAYCVSVLDDDELKMLKERTFMNAKRGKDWKNYELEILVKPPDDAVEQHQAKLKDLLKDFVQRREGCAEHAVPLAFRSGTKQVFVLKMDDRPVPVERWAESAKDFNTEMESHSIKLAVTLDDENERLSVHYRKGKKARAIAEIFCNEVLGEECYNITGEVTHDLSYFIKNADAELGGSPDGTIKNVSVVELYVNLAGIKDSRRTYFELSKSLYTTIADELSAVRGEPPEDAPHSVFPIGTTARRVKLRVTYDTAKKKDVQRMFELTPSSEIGFQEAPRRLVEALRGILKARGVIVERKNDDGAVAGAGDSAGK
ncbi:MAG: hypothetical protein IJQ34_03325 [Kiritimatiellae bacterium]|nr:hypothetical protein [Kiritimatiellia bacterium]